MSKQVVVSEENRLVVEKLCNEIGVPQAADKLGLSRDSVIRVVAKQPIRKGTLLVLEQALKEM